MDCDNSHTPLPYIDLVIEVLENAIKPLKYETNPVFLSGKAITLPIPKPPEKYPQTDEEASVLKAYPQHLNSKAYEPLQDVTYPWNLPFNLWMQEVRLYLEHLGVPRWQLMESILGGPADAKIIAREYLQLTKEESSIITDPSVKESTLNGYWGESPNNLKKVPCFLKQSGLSYDELKALLTLRYIRAAASDNPLSVVFNPPSSCKISDATIENLTPAGLSRIHRFVRFWRKTEDSMVDLDRTIMAFGGDILAPVRDSGESDFLTIFADLNRVAKLLPKKASRSEMLTWWTTLDTHKHENEAASFYEKIIPESVAEEAGN